MATAQPQDEQNATPATSATDTVQESTNIALGPSKRKISLAVIGGLSGLLTIIGTVIAFLAFNLQLQDSASSDSSQATMVAIMQAQLDVQREIATVQANPVRSGPTATALSERQDLLFATQQSLEQARVRAEATATAVARQPNVQANAEQARDAVQGPLVVNCPATLLFGQTAACGLDAVGEVDSYTFEANVNDQLVIRAARVSGSFLPSVSLTDSFGNVVCQVVNDRLALISDCAITSSGTHTLTIADYHEQQTGTYRLFVQRKNQAGLAQSLRFGVPATGEIAAVGDLVSFSFPGEINDQILLRVVRDSGAFAPLVSIVDPNGRTVCENIHDTITMVTCSLTESGTYALFVDDYHRRSTGTFRAYFQRLNVAENASSLALETSVAGSIDAVGEFDVYSLESRAGETLTLQVTRTSGAFAPHVRVFDPAGALLCEQSGNTEAVMRQCAILAGGMHTVLVDDYRMQQVGGYTLIVESESQ